MTCQSCESAKARAKAAGHRDRRTAYACYDCAAGDLDEYFARIGYVPDEALVARELAKMNAMHAQRPEPAAPAQLDLFGAGA